LTVEGFIIVGGEEASMGYTVYVQETVVWASPIVLAESLAASHPLAAA